MVYESELYHFGILGMRWGIRRFEDSSGHLTAAGKARYDGNPVSKKEIKAASKSAAKESTKKASKTSTKEVAKKTAKETNKKEVPKDSAKKAVKEDGKKTTKDASTKTAMSGKKKAAIALGITAGVIIGSEIALRHRNHGETNFKEMISKFKNVEPDRMDYARSYLLGQHRVDQVLDSGQTFKRLQMNNDRFEEFPAYLTYKDSDSKMYAGLFGTTLQRQAHTAAVDLEKKINSGELKGDELKKAITDYNAVKDPKIYQLSIKATNKMRIPSDQNAGKIVKDLSKDKDFAKDLKQAIWDHKRGIKDNPNQINMKRLPQQKAFNQALKALDKDPSKWTEKDSIKVYNALNMTLTSHHTEGQKRVQNQFYQKLKAAGYDALHDINDERYSSYHSKNPVIVFSNDKMKLESVTELPKEKIDAIYKKEIKNKNIREGRYEVANFLSDLAGLKKGDLKNIKKYQKIMDHKLIL